MSAAWGYHELVANWKALEGKSGLSVREVPCEDGLPLLLVEANAVGKPVISIVAGTHGDEAAPPWALLSLVRDGLLDPSFSYRLWPCVNPSGYLAGTRTNAEGKDIDRSFAHGGRTAEARVLMEASRDRQFTLQIDLHEHYDGDGFYCSEPTSQPGELLGPSVLAAVEKAGLPLQAMHKGLDLAFAYETLTLERGHVLYDPMESGETLSGPTFNIYLFCRRAAQRALTLESPLALSWEERIVMHRVGVLRAIERLGVQFTQHPVLRSRATSAA